MNPDLLWWTLVVVLIAVGLAGTVLPLLPGTALILGAIVLGGWIDGFTRVGWITIGIAAVLTIISWVLEYLAGLMGAKKAGASGWAIAGAAIGTVVGLFMGIVGILFMPLAGAAIGEYIARRDHERSVKVGLATWLGIMVGMVAKVVIAFMMVGLFIVALVF